MRRSHITFATAAGMAIFVLAGYQSGPAVNGQGNRTTSGTNGTCSGSGCHGANNANTSVTLNLMEGSIPVTDGQYKPNTLYSVTLTGINTVSPPTAYGFQLTAVTATGGQAGTFTASGVVHTASVAGLTVVEHNVSIPATGGSATTPIFTWLSPPAGTGAVSFHAIMNAVNGNNFSDAGDHASTAKFTIADKSLSADEIDKRPEVAIYPSPAADRLNVSLMYSSAEHSAEIIIRNIAGKEVYKTFTRDKTVVINTRDWAKGMYVVFITNPYGNGRCSVLIR